MYAIEAHNIHKRFRSGDVISHVLNGISLTIAEGEFVGIMGKSGAGKSTLLYQLSALDHPSEGSIRIHDTDILALSRTELGNFRLNTLGYIFQDYALIPDLRVSENVILPLLMKGVDWFTASDIAQATLDRVGIGHAYASFPTELSGGEQQRVAIARAVAAKPKIIFADEPTANLDSVAGQAVIDLLASIHACGQTIVMITHEEEYATVCSRTIRIEDGRIIEDSGEKNAHHEMGEQSYVNPVHNALMQAREKKNTGQ